MKSPSGLRPIKFKLGVNPNAEGSCLVSMGQTQVLCSATVQREAPAFAEAKGHGWVTAEYAMLPRSGKHRLKREKAFSGGRAQEISRLIGRSLRASVNLSALSGVTVVVDCDVLVADGGTRTASINGGVLALASALKKLKKEKVFPIWPFYHFIGAVSVGLAHGKTILDMDYQADSKAETDLNLVMGPNGRILEIQGTAEGAPFSKRQLDQMILVGEKGIGKILKAQQKAFGKMPKN